MIILNHDQGTPEWMAARAGLPTASCFDKIITTKGEPSKQREKYLYQLAGERILGVKEESYQNEAMDRGIRMEAEARELYEMITGDQVKQVGLCVTDCGRYGCSPDGLTEKRGLEIKCPTLAVHISYLLAGKLPTDYFQQVQGQLLVTEKESIHFLSYYPGIKPLMVEVESDLKFQMRLHSELVAFCQELDEISLKLENLS